MGEGGGEVSVIWLPGVLPGILTVDFAQAPKLKTVGEVKKALRVSVIYLVRAIVTDIPSSAG